MRRLPALVASLTLCAIAWSATTLAQTPHATEVAALVKRLTATKIPELESSIPPAAQRDFTDLKRRLPVLVLAHLNTIGNPASAETDLRAAVGKDLAAAGSPFVQNPPPVQQMTAFGLLPVEGGEHAPPFTLINMVARRVANHDDLIAVASVVLVPCSWDISLFLYQWSGHEWKLVLVQQGYDYQHLQENLDVAFVDGPKTGGVFVAAAFNGPWCSSCWSTVQMLAVRPGEDPFRPVMVKRVERSFYRCGGVRLTSAGDVFKLKYSTNDSHKGAVGFVSTRIEEFAVKQGRVQQRAWVIPKSAISSSTVRIVYQDAAQRDRAVRMRILLQAKGFNVVAETSPSYQEMPNTIRYFRQEDDELANWIGTLVYDIEDWPLSEAEIPAQDTTRKAAPGTIEIWICDEAKNGSLAPKQPVSQGVGNANQTATDKR